MTELVLPFSTDNNRTSKNGLDKEIIGATKNHICELLAFCLQHHGYRIKSFILGNNIAVKILKLLKVSIFNCSTVISSN